MTDPAVLYIVFNRPDLTERTFQFIRDNRIRRLYVAADGARANRPGEQEKVDDVRRIVAEVDWDCRVSVLNRETNLGCRVAVRSAIDWFFENESEGIVLEDDCLPDPSFIPYCRGLLEKYRHDTRIMAISGDNFQNGRERTEASYYFSKYPHAWGWATWKRAWKLYDRDLETWPMVKKEIFQRDVAGGDKAFADYWQLVLDACWSGRLDTWDFQWYYSCWIQHGLAIVPRVNLVSHLGCRLDATHLKTRQKELDSLPRFSIEAPLRHPNVVVRNASADEYLETNLFKFR